MKINSIEYRYGEREIQTINSYLAHARYRAGTRTIGLLCLFVFFWFFTRNSIYVGTLSSLSLFLLLLIWGNYAWKRIGLQRCLNRSLAKEKIASVTKKYYRGDALVVDKTGSLPLLGQLFPKRWGKKMYVLPHYYVVVDSDTYIVDKATYQWIVPEIDVRLIFTRSQGVFLNLLPNSN